MGRPLLGPTHDGQFRAGQMRACPSAYEGSHVAAAFSEGVRSHGTQRRFHRLVCEGSVRAGWQTAPRRRHRMPLGAGGI
jgi:hypothetical protein